MTVDVKRLLRGPAAAWASRALVGRPTVRRAVGLCYHSVHPTQAFSTVTPAAFEAHLAWVAEHCDFVPFRRLLDAASSAADRPAVSVTFDDGYSDNYEIVWPLLEKYHVPATIFIAVGLIERDRSVEERFRALRGVPVKALAWTQIRELRAAGIEIGAHTYSHPNLVTIPAPAMVTELQRSKQVIEETLQCEVDLLAYPFGKPRRHINDEIIRTAGSVGFKYGAAITYRGVLSSDPPLALPRFFTARDSIVDLSAKIQGAYDYLGFWQERLPMTVARLFSPQDFRW